jgi:hypothetical protein
VQFRHSSHATEAMFVPGEMLEMISPKSFMFVANSK